MRLTGVEEFEFQETKINRTSGDPGLSRGILVSVARAAIDIRLDTAIYAFNREAGETDDKGLWHGGKDCDPEVAILALKPQSLQ